MTVDVGLKSGMKYLWEQDMFLDFTIKAGGKEFLVHELVLVSVSDYFRTMLDGSMMETKKDEVEFPQFSAKRMSTLIEFIYTGSLDILENYPSEILECAVYFQMPKVIIKSTSILIDQLCTQNCLDTLAVFDALSLRDAAGKVIEYINQKAAKVMKRFKNRGMTAAVIQVMLNNWKKSDWDMFVYLTTWFSADFEHRKEYLNEFMSQVRFPLLTPEEIEAVKDMDVYKDGQGAWKDLVDNASWYDQLPIYKKVLVDSEQSGVRANKAVYIMDTDPIKSSGTTYVLDENNHWKSCGKFKQPDVSGTIPFVIEVNNFLITCSEFGENQQWQIFDPLKLTWSKIANMSKPKDEFAMVYHDKKLYVLGGTGESALRGTGESAQKEKVLTDTVEVYSFETNSWNSTIRLPVPVKNHAASVLNGAIYISGGEIATNIGTCSSTRLDRLDLTSKTWQSKAPLPEAKMHHNMCTMQMKTKEVLVFIDQDVSLISYYTPATDKWYTSTFTMLCPEEEDDDYCRNSRDHRWVLGTSKMLVKGNNVYLLGLTGKELKFHGGDEPQYEEAEGICVRFKIRLEEHCIDKYTLGTFPIDSGWYLVPSKTTIAGLFAIPEQGM